MPKNKIPLLRDADISPGMRVLVRVDFNVSIENGEVRGEFRILRSIKTIEYLRERGTKIILISHIESIATLEPVSRYLKNKLPHTFIQSLDSQEGEEALHSMQDGDVVLVENIRNNPGEKMNDPAFAAFLASYADLYVNDAFSVSHRAHASIVGVPSFVPGCAGFLLEEEIKTLSLAFTPDKPLLLILGGAKFETKLPLIEKFQTIADTLVIGGALANDIYKARGWEVGDSLVSGEVDLTHIAHNKKIVAPERVVVERAGELLSIGASEVQKGDSIEDASPEWILSLEETIRQAKTILWNGPMGKYESNGKEGTVRLAQLIAESEAYSIVGGGDTLTVIADENLEEKFGFISTGGGAMLDFLASGTLPGINALTVRDF